MTATKPTKGNHISPQSSRNSFSSEEHSAIKPTFDEPVDGRNEVDGQRLVAAKFFTVKMLPLAHPEVPRFSKKANIEQSDISLQKLTTMHSIKEGVNAAKREAEIYFDECKYVATVTREDGEFIVKLEPFIFADVYSISQDDFNKTVKSAMAWISGDDSSSHE